KKFISEQKIKVLYEGYDLNELCDSGEQIELTEIASNNILAKKTDISCVIVGSLQSGKGHIDAINAIHHLTNKGLNIKLYIVGKGHKNYKDLLISTISLLNLEDHIFFLGYLKSPLNIMKQCNVLLMCSRNEAFGLVTIEAMSLGKPVIGTQSGGTTEIIKDGFNGLFYS